MKKFYTAIFMIITLVSIAAVCAMDKGHGSHDTGSAERIGELFHESMKDGYMLSYYLMDLREQHQDGKASEHAAHAKKDMAKPHHIMVYIMDKDHKPITRGKVGFLIKDETGNTQKIMGMYMSKGFGITADMKKKGTYSITTKAVLDGVKLMDRFDHEMK